MIKLTFLFSLMLINSLTMVFTNSSIMMMILVISQTFLVCISIKSLMNITWFAFILFLVFVGGLLVLFIYIISLTPNTQLLINKSTIFFMTTAFILTIIFSNSALKSLMVKPLTSLNITNYSLLIKLYSNTSLWATFMSMTYLLLVLIVVVFIILTDRGSMKSMMIKK